MALTCKCPVCSLSDVRASTTRAAVQQSGQEGADIGRLVETA